MEHQEPRDRVWQAGMDALAFTGGGAVWATMGMTALFPHDLPFVPVGAGLATALLVGAGLRCLLWAARPPDVVAEAVLPASGFPTRRAQLLMRVAIPGIALAVVVFLWLAPPAQVVPALALVSGLLCLALAVLSQVRLTALVGVVLGGLALATSLLVPDQADARAVIGLGSAVALWSGAVVHLRYGSILVARARPR